MTPAAVAVIRAAALRNNLQKVRDLAPGCRVLAVIKANAYGHGLVSVARILDGADGLAVARLGEAVELRDAGIDRRVVVLGGFVGEYCGSGAWTRRWCPSGGPRTDRHAVAGAAGVRHAELRR